MRKVPAQFPGKSSKDNDLASAGMEIPWEVVYPCTVMTFLVYLYMFWTIFCPQSMGG